MHAPRVLRASFLALAILATPMLAEARKLDLHLQQLMPAVAPGETLEVIVSFHGTGPATALQLAKLSTLGLKGVSMRGLPIVGVRATPAQINKLLAMPEVRSVWHNAPLDYENREATALTGVDKLRNDEAIRIRGVPVSGRGVGVLVNDSGVDGLHPDVAYPQHVKQNVLAQTNLHSVDALLPVTYTEGVHNTDIGGGHGTHCAGIIGGNGAASGGDQEGVAPGAGIIGYGSGAALFILDTVGGFDYALTHQAQYNIRVVSNSFGNTSDVGTDFDPDDPTNIATKALSDRGVIVVFSAGNSGSGEGTITGNFKKAPWVVTVAAGDKQGRLADFSSRGEAGRGGTVTLDGKAYTWADRPTVTAPGVDIVSTRASLGTIDKLEAQFDLETLGPALAARYTHMSGTSMAAPHIAGVVALMLEANPQMTWREVKQVLQETASNIPGRAAWEAGAGYVNAYAAVQKSLGSGAFGTTVNANRSFYSNAIAAPSAETTYSLDYTPVLPSETVSFTVGSDVAVVAARANVGDNAAAIWLTDPNGTTYKSSVGLPVLGANIAATAPGIPGTWTLTLKGTQATGTGTNGGGLPATIDVKVKQVRIGGFTGLNDIAGHAGRQFIEYGVSNRLVDGYSDGNFRPDQPITRGEMATYLTMGAGLRQQLPVGGTSGFSDLAIGSPLFPFAQAATARGGSQRDLSHLTAGVMGTTNGAFRPTDAVSRVSLAYSLVQGLGLQAQAAALSTGSSSQTAGGSFGVSVDGMETRDIPVTVEAGSNRLQGSLAWDAGVPAQDLDLFLLDPNGNQIGSGATTDNPEIIDVAVSAPGTYTWRIKAYATVASSYTLTSTQSGAAGGAPLTVATADGSRLPIQDAASIPAALRGYVQLALDLGLLNARFTLTQGEYDATPVMRAYFDPAQTVTRAAYAAAASRLHGVYGQ
jgi:subtilisin family serine protease